MPHDGCYLNEDALHDARDAAHESWLCSKEAHIEMNPLGLTAEDLIVVGWNSDASGEQWSLRGETPLSFLEACALEAQKVE